MCEIQEMELEALRENLPEVMDFISAELEARECPMKTQMQICLAVEEIFINIASYAYAPATGRVKLRMQYCEDPAGIQITLTDSGVPYDPLAKEDPDVTLPAEKRKIGGLGIYLVKKTMDEVSYEYKDGTNNFTMIKRFA